MTSSKTHGVAYLEEFEHVSSKILKHSQFFGAAPYPIDLSLFSESSSNKLEKLLQFLQLLWIISLYITCCSCSYFLLVQVSGEEFIVAMFDILTSCLDMSTMTVIFVYSRRFKKKYRLVTTRIGAVLYAFQQHGLTIDISKLWRTHQFILLISITLIIPSCCCIFVDGQLSSQFIAFVLVFFIELTMVLCFTQYYYALGLIREILRCTNTMLKNINTLQNRSDASDTLSFIRQKIFILSTLIDEIIQMFGLLVIILLFTIVILGAVALYSTACFYDQETVTFIDVCYLIENLLILALQILKLVLVTHPQSCIKYEVRTWKSS